MTKINKSYNYMRQYEYLKRIILGSTLLYILFLVARYILNPSGDYLKELFPNEFLLWKGWHLVVFFLLGYYSPNYWYLSLFLGMLWEFTEFVIDKTDIINKLIGNNAQISLYKESDFALNSIGLILGYFFRMVTR
uniref:Uncharacterized protein n=1 Tax=viral metagenome TaxID=1070528 RepID=A0A6C0FCP7_9ZZZZ